MKNKYYSVASFLFILTSLLIITVSATPNMENVSIFQVTKNGPQLMVILDYDFNTAPVRDSEKALVVLTLLSLPSDDGMMAIEGSLLFIRTDEGDSFLFWTLCDPFISSVIWQEGNEMEHFLADQNELSLIFIEFSNYDDPELEIVVLAKILEPVSIDPRTNDFQEILFSFIPDLPVYPDTSTSTTTTTTTTTTKSIVSTTTTTTHVSYGFEWIVGLGIIYTVGVRKQRKGS